MTLLGNDTALTGLWFDGQQHFPLFVENVPLESALPVFEQTRLWLDVYFNGERPDFTPPLSFDATPFRETVWQVLLAIPYGQTTTYAAIARAIAAQRGSAMSAQAVGGAVGHNPISLIVPCHRVVGAQGNLTGYAGGLDRKIKLLALEGIDTRRLHMP